MVLEGFEVHHVDGNHQNNDPGNLVLIEVADHVRLHRGQLATALAHKKRASPKRRVPPNAGLSKARKKVRERWKTIGSTAYETRKAEGLSWLKISRRLGSACQVDTMMAATEYARVNNLPWPPITNDAAVLLRRAISLEQREARLNARWQRQA